MKGDWSVDFGALWLSPSFHTAAHHMVIRSAQRRALLADLAGRNKMQTARKAAWLRSGEVIRFRASLSSEESEEGAEGSS